MSSSQMVDRRVFVVNISLMVGIAANILGAVSHRLLAYRHECAPLSDTTILSTLFTRVEQLSQPLKTEGMNKRS